MASSRQKLEDRVKRKEIEIQELELKIREAQAYVQAMQDAIKLLPREDREEAGGGEATLRPGSAVDEARNVLLSAGKPLHISKILSAMGREVTRSTRAGLSGSLAAYVRREEIFTRPAPNTFGLVDFSSKEKEVNPIEELPPNFGKDEEETPF